MKIFQNIAEVKDIEIQLNKLGFNVSYSEQGTTINMKLSTNPAYKGVDLKELKNRVLSYLTTYLPKNKKIEIDFVDLKIA